MTINELRAKYPQDAIDKTDSQLDLYCRSIELVANIFMDYAISSLQKSDKKLDTYEKYSA